MTNSTGNATFNDKKPARIIESSCSLRIAYRVANPSQYIVKTGLGCKGMKVAKKTVQLPFQTVAFIDMNPRNFHFELHNMSSELVPFNLPVVFTIGPVSPEIDIEAFRRYASQLSALTADQITSIIGGMIQGETRILSAHMTVREMFADRDKFRDHISDKVQKDLNAFGLRIYNANIAEMRDLDTNNKYFENLKQKALEGANTEARIQVAEARKMGDIGERQRQGETKIETARIDAKTKAELENANAEARMLVAEAKRKGDVEVKKKEGDTEIESTKVAAAVRIQENLRQQEVAVSDSQLQIVKTNALYDKEAAEIAVAKKKAALDIDLLHQLAVKEQESVRATTLAQQTVEAEVMRVKADAELYKERQKAQAVVAHAQAYAAGLKSIISAAESNSDFAAFYLGMEKGLFERLAEKNAAALQGLSPKINVWDTGNGGTTGGDGSSNPLSSIRNLFTSLPPMLEAVSQQTNVKLPSFLPKCPPTTSTNKISGSMAPSSSSINNNTNKPMATLL